MLRRLAMLMLMITALERRCAHGPSPVVSSGDASTFADMVGVNVHLQYGATAYKDLEKVKEALAYLGVRHLRDSALRHGSQSAESFAELGRAGFRFDLFFNAELSSQLDRVISLERAAHGAVETIEGPNEVNNDPIVFRGLSGVEGARAYQAALYERVHAANELRGRRVLNYTNYPPTSGAADAINVHSYARSRASPGSQLAHDMSIASAALQPGLPIYVTETGYATVAPSLSADAVTPDEQGDLILIALLDAFRSGVARVYLYELLDEQGQSSAPGDAQAHYGLFDAAGRPKPAARKLHELLGLLADLEGPRSWQKRPMAIRIAGGGAMRILTLDRRDGRTIMLLWRERGAGDATAQTEIEIDPGFSCERRKVDLLTGRKEPPIRGRAWRAQVGLGPIAYVLNTDELAANH